MHRRSPSRLLHLGLAAALLVCPASSAEVADPEPAPEQESPAIPPGEGTIDEFIGCELRDGSRQLASVGPGDMPWRVAIGKPRISPRFGSRAEAREAAIESMRQWERAIRTELPWFQLEFVEKDRGAPVQIEWKRRMTGDAAGRAGPTCRVENGEIRAGGAMEIAVRSCPTCRTLELEQIRLLVAHEFGHILGLGHCLDCDSAMNYSWSTRERVFVTGTDVEAVVRRFAGGS